MNHHFRLAALILLSLCVHLTSAFGQAGSSSIGVFQAHSDVGAPMHAGSVQYDPARGAYVVSGGGANMWTTNDAFQFVWKKVSGDVSLAADIKIIGSEGDAHRKACLMIRQNLDADSVYADVALHGNGLTALQYREAKGAITKDVKISDTTPARLRIEKKGDNITVSVAAADAAIQPTAGPIQLHFESPFYVGIAVCAHDNKTLRQALFTKVELTQ